MAAHELARQQMAERITRHFVPFKKEEKVWLEAKNLNLGIPYRKLKPKREGPFEIIKVLSPWTYQLRLPPTWKIHPVFHALLLSPYKQNETHGPSFSTPPPDMVKGEEEYEVEAIVGHKGKGIWRRYLIKWKGYPSSENTWQTERSLSHARTILREYKRRKGL